ncbi:hypothetical protein [Tuwongella immobilis]|uniref:Uncharacterized protein n=1 Tax=Tuwongella immobilis TaxID=692036 RepID=A0A6C2YQY4_9BACT|nr:hypothetical protein [Tuwongella immobilis]VIP04058.1 unnamed protein product [Tuwongella immobilis]VTS05483.1 unnamed protein product [Tuwongella immobilis]
MSADWSHHLESLLPLSDSIAQLLEVCERLANTLANQRSSQTRVELNSILTPEERREPPAVERFRRYVGKHAPELLAAWATFEQHLPPLLRQMAADREVRQYVRASALARAAWLAFVGSDDRIRDFAQLLAVLDDAEILLIDPRERLGWHLQVAGIDRIRDLHLAWQWKAGTDQAKPESLTPQFWLWHPRVLQRWPELPPGLAGSDDWLWEHRSAATLPRIDSRFVALIGPPPFLPVWETSTRHPGLLPILQQITPLPSTNIDSWIKFFTYRITA